MNLAVTFLIPILGGKAVRAEQVWEINEHHSSSKYLQFGDVLLTPSQAARYKSAASSVRGGATIKENLYNRWPNNTVPYAISDQYGNKSDRYIRKAINSLQMMTCFKFVERSVEPDYLMISPLDGCYSFVGRIGGRQILSLSRDCLADYIIWHELMHAIGFEHEHQRPDRDNFIRVEYSNVQPGQMVNFEKLRPDSVDAQEPYDYRSIMHYNAYSFGRVDLLTGKRLATMTPLKNDVELLDNLSLSPVDLRRLRVLGNCKDDEQANICMDSTASCAKFARQGLCTMEAYRELLERDCRRSCRKCQQGRLTTSRMKADQRKEKRKCEDSEPNCLLLTLMGFCTNPFYKHIWSNCAKSCNLC